MGIVLMIWKFVEILLIFYVSVLTIFTAYNGSKNLSLSFLLGFFVCVIYTIFKIFSKTKILWISFFWFCVLILFSAVFILLGKNSSSTKNSQNS